MSAETYINRDLSWLAFNDRVADEAENVSVPLFGRLNFLTIAANNLDEFASVRMASVQDQVWEGVKDIGPDGRNPVEALTEIARAVRVHKMRLQQIWRGLRNDLTDKADIRVLTRDEVENLEHNERNAMASIFSEHIFPLLTPIVIDPVHKFPFLQNKAMATLYVVKNRQTGKEFNIIIPLPNAPRLVELPSEKGKCYALIEHVIRYNIDLLLPNTDILDFTTFRVLRDAELDLGDDASNITQNMELALQQRKRGDVIQLTLNDRASAQTAEFLKSQLDLDDAGIIKVDGQIGLVDLAMLKKLATPEHSFEPYNARYPERVRENNDDIFAAIRQKDFMVHHPFESFDVVVGLLNQAAQDPQVATIKQTLYRTSADSQIVRALIEAARNGKSVTAVVEIKARFDEAANLKWAHDMEREGVTVIRGNIDYKIHGKMTLIARRENNGLRAYCHLGTGNYHPLTARFYTDVSFFTADPEIGRDVALIFNFMTGNMEPQHLSQIAIAPHGLRHKLYDMIDGEIANAKLGSPAAIWIKCNSVEDPAMIEKLYEASRAGVQIDMIVRGICCLRPGVPGLSENIRVKSIVGRYLEHARIYAFANGHEMPSEHAKVFLSSADLMTRNLSRRIETLVPATNATVRQQLLDQIMVMNLRDNVQSWVLQPDGQYARVMPEGTAFCAHDYFMNNPSLSGRGTALKRSFTTVLEPKP